MVRTVLGRDSLGRLVDIPIATDSGSIDDEVGPGAHPDLATHVTLGLSAEHAHSYAATSHAHVDADIPAAIARDAEVTAAIDTHAGTPHGGSLPAGLIVMWGGLVANIPSGWALCDGSNGTPDLRGRFIKGASAEPGGTGGAATHTHAGHTDHSALTHSGATVGDHAVTQPSAHPDHAALSHSAHAGATVANHTDVLNHTHPENRNSATTGGLDGWAAGDTSTSTPLQTGYVTGNPSANGVAAQVHTVGQASAHSDHGAQSHSAHSGTAVDAHAVGQASQHGAQSHSAHDNANSEPAYYALCFIQKV